MTPAGWYPDGLGAERYWDGAAWTEQTRAPGGVTGGVTGGPSPGLPPAETMMARPVMEPVQVPAAPAALRPPYPPAGQPSYGQPSYGPPSPRRDHTTLIVVGAVVTVVVLGGIVGAIVLAAGGSSDQERSERAASELADDLVAISPTGPPVDLLAESPSDEPSDAGTLGAAEEAVGDAYFAAYAASDCSFIDYFAPDTLATYGLSVDDCLAAPELIFTENQDGCGVVFGNAEVTDSVTIARYQIGGCVDPTVNEVGTIEFVLVEGEWKIVDIFADES